MADNVAVTEGAGKTVATDDIQVDATHAQGQVQFVKLVDGTLNGTGSVRVNQAAKANALTIAPASDITDGTYIGDIKFGEALATVTNLAQLGGAAIAMNEGVLAAGVQRVTLATNDDAVAHLATIAGDTTNIETAIQLLDNAVDGNYLNVNLNIAGTDCDGGSGAQGAQTQRVILATDDPAVAHLNNILTAVQVMDDWDDANYCNVNLNLAGTDAGAGEGALDGTELRVTIATDDDGVAHLATIAGAVSTQMQCDIVEGTVTTVSTVTNLSQLGGTAITMDEGVHDAGCQRVTIATDDDGVAHLATIAGDTTNIETAIQIIDDWDATHGSAPSADGPQLMAAYDSTKPTAVTDNQSVRVLADEYGRLLEGVEKTAWQEDYDSADASGEGEAVKASAASTIVVVQSYIISVDAEMWVKLQMEDSTALTGKFWLKAGGGVAITLPKSCPLVLGVDSDLEVITEGAGNISVSATGYTIPG